MNAYFEDGEFYCEACDLELDKPNGEWLLKHPASDCQFSKRIFHSPRVKLEETPSVNPDKYELETTDEPPIKRITSSPIKPEPSIKPHFWRHLFSGTIVFLLGVCVNEGLSYVRERAERKVKWVGGELGSFRPWADDIVTNVQNVQMGVAQDGRIVWREKK